MGEEPTPAECASVPRGLIMTSTVIQFGLLCFVSQFTMINPLGVLPVYVAMTADLPAAEATRVARKATLTAFVVLVLFAAVGALIFRFFSVSVNSLRIVGGVLFFVMGYEMLQARLSRTKIDEESARVFAEDVAITPIGIPMIAGPGAIASVILLWNDAVTPLRKLVLIVAVLVVLVITCTLLLAAKRVVAALGASMQKVFLRLMGLIVMMIAVEFFLAGLKPILKALLS
jgi:multiple antibiotic resistance protein